jgi:hypothetical protein
VSDLQVLLEMLAGALGAEKVVTDPASLIATSHDTWPVSAKWARQELVRRTGSFFWSADGDAAAVDHVSDVLERAHGYPAGVRKTQQADYEDQVARSRGRRVPLRGGP